jgi:hypothetical protein
LSRSTSAPNWSRKVLKCALKMWMSLAIVVWRCCSIADSLPKMNRLLALFTELLRKGLLENSLTALHH